MKNYRREKQEHLINLTMRACSFLKEHVSSKKIKCVLLILALVIATGVINAFKTMHVADNEDDLFSVATAPIAAATAKRNVISIPTGIVKANPFVPYRSLGDEVKVPTFVNDVPKFDLIAPPESLGENENIVKMMDTVVSGILYDKFSPSAILKIDGKDYLVKKGDQINNYKVIAIAQDSVTVKYANNTYKAGIGEILTEGNVNHNDISNLNKKFGGEKR